MISNMKSIYMKKFRASTSLQLVSILVAAMAVSAITSYGVYYLNVEKNGAVVQRSDAPIGAAKPRASRSVEISSIQDLNDRLVEIADSVKPSVVTVFTEKVFRVRRVNPFMSPFFDNDLFGQFFGRPRDGRGRRNQPQYEERRRHGMGSGVIVSKDGYIITNNHVIARADEIKVRVLNGQTYEASVVGADPQTDIAVIKVEAEGLVAIEQGDSDRVRVGEIVLAVGSPLNETLAHTVTQGIVSAKGRSNVGLAEYEDFIQTDADINPGNSGGALVNLDGQLVGINTAIATQSGGSQGIGFAVPVNMAKAVKDALIANGEVTRSWLGVHVQNLNEEIRSAMGIDQDTKGVLVAGIQKNSPAEKAGLQAGDLVLKIDGEDLDNSAEMRNRIAVAAPGSEIKLLVLREGRELTLEVKLERLANDGEPRQSDKKTSSQAIDLLGFSVVDLDAQLRQRLGVDEKISGVVVTEVDPNSSAASAGLQAGDLVRSVNKKPVANLKEFNARVTNLKANQMVLLRITRRNATLFLAYTLRPS